MHQDVPVFTVVSQGTALAGFLPEQVIAQLQQQLRLPLEQAERLLQGSPLRVRRGLAKLPAQALSERLQRCGLACRVVQEAQEERVAPPGTQGVSLTLECPRCAHPQPVSDQCSLCRMDLRLHRLRLQRREQLREGRQRLQAQQSAEQTTPV